VIGNLQASSNEPMLTPPGSGHKDQLEYVFDEWVHLQMESMPKKTVGAFIYQLHQQKVMETQESSVAFIRTCIDSSVAAYEQETEDFHRQ
jgi:CCR4-NOT transcription complex subunit 1